MILKGDDHDGYKETLLWIVQSQCQYTCFLGFEYLTLSMVNLNGTKVNNQNAVKKMKFILKITILAMFVLTIRSYKNRNACIHK